MERLAIIVDGQGAWPDLADRAVLQAKQVEVAGLADGTQGGNPTVAIRADMTDGQVAIVETTLRLFLSAADALRERYGDPRKDDEMWVQNGR